MKNNKTAPSNLGALFNKKDTIIAVLMVMLITFLWFETTKFEKVPDLFSNNIPPEMFPQILLIIILGMILIIPFEHMFLKKSGKNIDSARSKPVEMTTIGTGIYQVSPNLWVAGDYLAGGRVEGAYLSGLEAAERILAR